MGPQAHLLPGGTRLHLQHGPIDLIIGAEGDRKIAFAAAQARFATVLEELVRELPALRQPLSTESPPPNGSIACQMHLAAYPYAAESFVTPMAAVAGAVADHVLHAICAATPLTRAYVNNGGDIALHLTKGQHFTSAMSGHDGSDLGRITITQDTPIRGIATSGRHGRSLSLGIADSVTVLARTAAEADVAATMIANAVDLPDHPAITRAPASSLDDNSDLGDLPVVTHCSALPATDRRLALEQGRKRADDLVQKGRILGAALFLQGDSQSCTAPLASLSLRTAEHA